MRWRGRIVTVRTERCRGRWLRLSPAGRLRAQNQRCPLDPNPIAIYPIYPVAARARKEPREREDRCGCETPWKRKAAKVEVSRLRRRDQRSRPGAGAGQCRVYPRLRVRPELLLDAPQPRGRRPGMRLPKPVWSSLRSSQRQSAAEEDRVPEANIDRLGA